MSLSYRNELKASFNLVNAIRTQMIRIPDELDIRRNKRLPRTMASLTHYIT